MRHSHRWEATVVTGQPAMICTQRGCRWLWFTELDIKTNNVATGGKACGAATSNALKIWNATMKR